MVIKAIIIKENNKPVKCVELVEFQDADQFNKMVETCSVNAAELKKADLSKEAQYKKRIYDLEKKLAEIEQKVANNTKLIMGENEDEEEH